MTKRQEFYTFLREKKTVQIIQKMIQCDISKANYAIDFERGH